MPRANSFLRSDVSLSLSFSLLRLFLSFLSSLCARPRTVKFSRAKPSSPCFSRTKETHTGAYPVVTLAPLADRSRIDRATMVVLARLEHRDGHQHPSIARRSNPGHYGFTNGKRAQSRNRRVVFLREFNSFFVIPAEIHAARSEDHFSINDVEESRRSILARVDKRTDRNRCGLN